MRTAEPTTQDRSRVAGYHVYWTATDPHQAKKPDELEVRQGVDPQGQPLLVDPDTYLKDSAARRAPGYYRFVAVGHDGEELEDLPVINQQLIVKPATPVALSQNLKAQVLESILAGGKKQPEVAAAIERAGGEEGARILIEEVAGTDPQLRGRALDGAAERDWYAAHDRLVRLTLQAFERVANEEPGWFRVDLTSLETLLKRPWLCHERHIRAAVTRGDYNDAAVRALARAQLESETAPELLLDILVGIDLKAVSTFLLLSRFVPGALLGERLRRGAFGTRTEDLERGVCAALAVWKGLPPEIARPLLVPFLRRAARRPSRFLSVSALLDWLTKQLDDAHLQELYALHHADLDEELLDFLGRSFADGWSAPIGELLSILPEHDTDEILGEAPGRLPDVVPVRVAEKVRRNEPCPCRSGKKFKKCCEGQPKAPPLEPTRARPSRVAALRDFSQRLEPDNVEDLPRSTLAQLDLGRLKKDTLVQVLRCHSDSHDWARARQARAEIARRCGAEIADQLWQRVVYEAIRAGQHDVARQLLADFARSDHAFDREFDLAVFARDAGALEVLETAAKVAVRIGGTAAFRVARAALHSLPNLGLLLARGALADASALPIAQLRGLLSEIEEVRDELGLAPGDPALAICGERDERETAEREDPARARLVQAATELRGKVDATTRRIAELERQLAEQTRATAATARAAAATSPMITPPDAEQRARQKQQKERIDELEARIREGNEERAQLRRQLTEVASQGSRKPPASHAGRRQQLQDADDAEDGMMEMESPPGGSRGVLIPHVGSAAQASLDTVPREIAAMVMRTLGPLAAGDAAAWRAVKQAKDMPVQLFMARIGIHHRMLFRTDQGKLEVVDVITRESLKTTLKRMRS